MAKTIKIIKTKFFLCLSVFLSLVVVFMWLDRENILVKSAPNDPEVNEMISQARALLKSGELENSLITFEKYAMRGHPVAMYHVGRAYARGWGTKPNLDKARHFFLLAASYSFAYRAETAYELGRLYQRSIGPECNEMAIAWFLKSLEWNHFKAAVQLAIHHEKGLGTPQNMARAIHYYKIAASHGSEQALLKYARVVLTGRYGVKADPEHAYELVNRALDSLIKRARNGSAGSSKQLGRLYRDGELLPLDYEQAKYWLLHAAQLGNTGGMHDYARLMLTISDKPAAHQEALEWLRNAANKGHGGAMNSLGKFHLTQKYGLEKAGALAWFKMGIAASHGAAIEQMAKLYLKGDLVEKNLEAAVKLLEKGVSLGHSGSARLLKRTQKSQTENPKSS